MTATGGADFGPEVLDYARDVRAALADVPAERKAELLEDLEEHLAEVAADGGAPLFVRLGPAAEYAAELRRAAGLSAPAQASAPTGSRWRSDLARQLAEQRASATVTAVRDFLPELRPAWWVVRAWGALLAVDAVFFGASSFPVPTLGLGPLIGLVLTAAAVTWSVRRGLRARQRPDTGSRPLALLANAVLAALTVLAVIAVAQRTDPAQASTEYYGPPAPTTLSHEDGAPITNIHPFSSTGEPLSGVLLYDQDGRAIENLAEYTGDGAEIVPVPQSPPLPANSFPREQQVLVYDDWGRPVPVPSTGPSPTGPSPTDAPPASTSAAPTTTSPPPEPTSPLGPVPTPEPTPTP
ncbi:HAAS signaling domain-containing protein [Modestobacter sp. URMC 112]